MVSIKNKEGSKFALLTFLYPLLGLLISIKYHRQSWAKNIFWIWCAFMGAVFIYHPDSGVIADRTRIADKFIAIHSSETSFNTLISSFYTSYDEVIERANLDLYFPILNFIVSRFTGNPHWIFFFYALVFGFFYSRSIWYVIENIRGRISLRIGILLFAFAATCSVWDIGGPRIWTAVQVFLYGVIPYIINNDKSKLVWCYLSIFFHFSLVAPVVFLTIYFLLPRNISVFFILFLIAQTISELNLESINTFLKNLGFSEFDNTIDTYASQNYLERRKEMELESSVYFLFQSAIFKYPVIIFNFITYFFVVRKNNIDNNIKNLFCFTLFFSAFAVFFANIPSGGRFITLSNMISIASFILIWQYLANRTYNFYISLFSLVMLIYIVTRMRFFAVSFGFDIFYQNFISVFFIENNVPIYPE